MPKMIESELKARAVHQVNVHLVEYPSLTAAAVAVAKQLGFALVSVRPRVFQSQIDDGQRYGATSEEIGEI